MKRIISYLAMAMALTACGSDDEILNEVQRGDRHPLQFTATVEDIQTRVTSDNKWEDGDIIGVKISNDPNNTIGQYKLNADGTVKEVIQGVEWQGTESATVTAWYPYTESAEKLIISNQQNGYLDYDILRAETEGSSAAPVKLVFQHQMAKVRCRLVAADGTGTGISGATVKFYGKPSIVVNNGNVTQEGQFDDITPYEDSESGMTTYTAMLPPHTVTADAQFIKITIGDKTVYYKPAKDINLEAGKSYNYQIKVNVPDYTTDADGTYHVYTAKGLNEWAKAVEGNTSTNCTLEADITLTGENNWTPVCQDYNNPYTGTFDGNGKSISGLNINSNAAVVGFIGRLGEGGMVKNLKVEGAYMSSTGSTANIGAVAGRNEGTISNCHVINTTISGKYQAGGVVGYNSHEISYCHVSDDCSVKVESNVYLGGIAGNHVSGAITACYALCSLGVTGDASVGGVFGTSTGSCTACYSRCTLSKEPTYAGGISGYIPGKVNACYWANVPGATYEFKKGIDNGTDTTVKVDGSEVTWSAAAEAMNNALGADCGYQYEVNGSSQTEPLKLVKKQ